MDAGIILAGQPLDVIGSLSRGQVAGAQIGDIRHAQDYRNALSQYGAGALNGDPTSMNALAGFDPAAVQGLQSNALGMDATRQNMAVQQEQMAMLRQTAAQEAQDRVTQLSAAEAAQAQERLNSVLEGGMMAPDEATYNAWMAQNGVDPAQYPFAQREMHAASLMGVLDALKVQTERAAMGATPTREYIATGEDAAALGLDRNARYNVTEGPQGISATPIGGTAPVTNINNNMGGEAFGEAFAKLDAAAIDTVSTAGMAAQRNLPRIDQLEAALQAGPSGAAAALAVLAGEYGIPSEGLDTLQLANSIISALVPEQRQPGSGPMSDADLALFKQSLPRLINQPGGNALIIATMRGIAQYDAQGAAIVQDLRAGKIDRAEAFRLLQSRANPIADTLAQSQGITPTDTTGFVPSQADIDLVNQFAGGN
jgi:hypothetical protein